MTASLLAQVRLPMMPRGAPVSEPWARCTRKTATEQDVGNINSRGDDSSQQQSLFPWWTDRESPLLTVFPED